MQADQQELLSYYQAELTYLRRMGAEFASVYPKIASRLELGPDGSTDPHVERLIEAFAFLTARVHQNIDEQFPEISTALLDVVYPQLLNPVPSMTVARFHVDPLQGKLTTGYLIPAETPLFADTREEGATCRFRTAYPVTLWPIEVSHAAFESTDRFEFLDHRRDVATVLRIQLQCTAGDFSELELDQLRFYINGELPVASSIYERLFAHGKGVALAGADGRAAELPGGAVTPVGFDLGEELLPYPTHSHPGYRLLQEYFAFPQKYLFFDLRGLAGRLSGSTADVLILLDEMPDARTTVNAGTFVLGCTPVINLFRKTSEPIRVDHRQLEYRLVADYRRERTTEIHSIRSVSSSTDEENTASFVYPFYSYDHDMTTGGAHAFWHARRVPSTRKEVPGTEIMLSFLDLNFDPRSPARDTVYAHTLCTNRRLAQQLPAGALLQTDFPAPVSRIVALHAPTAQMQPPIGGAAQWRLISHLSLNYLSLLDEKAGIRALREILRLYAPVEDAPAQKQISGTVSMTCKPVVRRMGPDAWRGFTRGTEISLLFDETSFVGSNAFLFASVLRHFFALYSSVNSFTQTVALSTRRTTTWKQWPPLAGEQHLL